MVPMRALTSSLVAALALSAPLPCPPAADGGGIAATGAAAGAWGCGCCPGIPACGGMVASSAAGPPC
eukprot:6964717-Alexandrium_andersonii.AAC.1